MEEIDVTHVTVALLVLGACGGSSNGSAGSSGLPEGNKADTDWAAGWTCQGLHETFVENDPASDPLHDWTQADVEAAHAELKTRC